MKSNWSERFDEMMQPPEYHPEYEGTTCIVCGWPMPNSKQIALLKSFIEQEIHTAVEETIQQMIALSDEIELQLGAPSMEEWRAFKMFRNTMRERLPTKKGTENEIPPK